MHLFTHIPSEMLAFKLNAHNTLRSCSAAVIASVISQSESDLCNASSLW